MNRQEHTYATVCEWDEKRTQELSRMLRPYLDVTNAYAELVCEIVDVIGTVKPCSLQDIVVRDLLADVFDALHEARRIILTCKCSIAYPVARRVYESLSLMVLCSLDASIATKWHGGREMKNAEVRKELAKHPLGETEESMRKLYSFFSLGAHPNRVMIPRRFLGEGNEFVLGSVGAPSLALVTDYCRSHLRMWFWFTAMLSVYYQRDVAVAVPEFIRRYMRVAKAAQELQTELDKNYNRLLSEEQMLQAADGSA